MRDGQQVLRDEPDWLLRRHPVEVVETAHLDGPGEGPQGALSELIEVHLKITERQFAQSSIDWLAIAATSVIGLCHRAPVAVHTVDGDDVVGIVLGFEVEQQRWIAVDAQGCRGKEGAFVAMRSVLAENPARGR